MQAASRLETTRMLDVGTAAPIVAVLDIESLISAQYHELRLASGASQADYLVAFSRSRAASLYARIAAGIERHPELAGAGWCPIESLLADWARASSLAARRTSMLWFELDDYERQPQTAVPSISVCLLPTYDIAQAIEPWSSEDLRHAHESLELLSAPPQAASELDTVFHALPASARWIHLSYMLGRPRRATKLYGVMPRSELLGYLERIGWAGDRAIVRDALQRLYPSELVGDELYLDLNLDDFRDAARCTLGLAVSQQHLLRGPDEDACRTAILERWLEAGLCDPEKVEEVRAWPLGAQRRRGPFQREVRFLDIKLVWRDQAWQAKAYIGRHRRLGPF